MKSKRKTWEKKYLPIGITDLFSKYSYTKNDYYILSPCTLFPEYTLCRDHNKKGLDTGFIEKFKTLKKAKEFADNLKNNQ